MDHRTEETLLAYLDGELAESERAACEAHLGRCGECAAALAKLRSASERLGEALETLDATARLDLRPPPRLAQRRRGRTWGLRSFAKAAVLVIAAAGAAAAAVPGSPVRAWIERAVERVAGLVRDEPAAVQEAASPRARGLPGVALSLAGGAGGTIRIELTRPHPDAIVLVRLVDAERAAVWSQRARYQTGPGRIEVVEASAGELVIEIPRAAREARVEVDGRLAVQKEGTQLRLVGVDADSAGVEVRFRVGSDSGPTP